ncbi:NmrA family NAD(P)-binding protein [Streptomyces sp. NPDC048172]|uniref:NmrA family NAD(P)-binding protein n=1 Tax=Streptomyces sp. NPDC048172 TaxID=3365505 RepID=UPI003718AAEE
MSWAGKHAESRREGGVNIRTILVTGATAQQCGAVATRLPADGWRVRALTRDASGEATRTLAGTGGTSPTRPSPQGPGRRTSSPPSRTNGR